VVFRLATRLWCAHHGSLPEPGPSSKHGIQSTRVPRSTIVGVRPAHGSAVDVLLKLAQGNTRAIWSPTSLQSSCCRLMAPYFHDCAYRPIVTRPFRKTVMRRRITSPTRLLCSVSRPRLKIDLCAGIRIRRHDRTSETGSHMGESLCVRPDRRNDACIIVGERSSLKHGIGSKARDRVEPADIASDLWRIPNRHRDRSALQRHCIARCAHGLAALAHLPRSLRLSKGTGRRKLREAGRINRTAPGVSAEEIAGAPKGNRTPVFAVRGRRTRPLYDGRKREGLV
jgi:hypothetical protein